MSYESFERIVESSHKMIAKELKDNLKDHFVPRKGLHLRQMWAMYDTNHHLINKIIINISPCDYHMIHVRFRVKKLPLKIGI